MKKPVELILDPDAPVTGVFPTDRQAALFFWLFLIGHSLIWIALPSILHPNSALDAVEMMYWGHEWELGYYKHPPLPAWLAESASWLGGHSMWPTYVLAQLSTAACFLSVFLIGREIGGNRFGLLNVLLLETCYYYNFTTTEFNNNVTSRGLCALAVLFLFFALSRNRWHYWMLSGLALGLGMLSKYDTALFAVVMLAFSVAHPRGRAAWRTPGPVLLLGTAAACFAPHVYWLVKHDFPTIEYAMERSSRGAVWGSGFLQPIQFLFTQLGAVLPLMLLAIPMTGRWAKRTLLSEEQAFYRDFALWFGVGPLLMVLGAALLTGSHIRSMWGTSLFTFSGLALLTTVQLRGGLANFRKVSRYCLTAGAVAVMALMVHSLVLPHFRHEGSRIHFPGQDLATAARSAYLEEVGEQLQMVGGPWWDAANVALVGGQRATVYADLDPVISPWASDEKFQQTGGVIVWQPRRVGEEYAEAVRERFPEAIFKEPVSLRWKTSAEIEPIEFQIAVIKPTANLTETQQATNTSVSTATIR